MMGGLLGGRRRSGNAVLDAVLPMLVKKGGGGLLGGLSGVLGGFARAGLGKQADSWVATGPNEKVSPEEVERALGSETIAKLAAKAGVSPGAASAQLSDLLPRIIDGLTPGGTVPGDLKKAARSIDLTADAASPPR